MILNNLFGFIVSGIFLLISGMYLVSSLNKISRYFRISEFTAAFIIMAIATSVPELFVGVSSALEGSPSLSLGNILGANVINLTLISGIFVLLGRGIKFKSKKINQDVYIMLFSIFLLITLYLIGNSLSRIDGIILLCLFFFNIYRKIKKREQYSKKLHSKGVSKKQVFYNILIFVVAVIILIFSSKFVVEYSISLAEDFNLPKIFIGLFLLSIATTLPELIFGINAILMKHEVMSIGDQAGTIFSNTTLILGVVCLINPISIDLNSFLFPAIFMLIAGFLFTFFIKSKNNFSIREATFMILFYLIFISSELLSNKLI